MTKTVTVYTQPACVQCDRTKKYLDGKGIAYETVDLAQDQQALAAVKSLGYMSAPVVIVNDNGDTHDEKHWYGFRPDLLAEFCDPDAEAAA